MVVAAITTACTSISVDSNGMINKRYIGWLEVVSKPKSGYSGDSIEKVVNEGRIERVKTLGLRIADGISIGYSDEHILSLPLDCRLVIVVKTIEQIRQIVENYPQLLKTKNLCVKSVDF
jgi:hypothetical protein